MRLISSAADTQQVNIYNQLANQYLNLSDQKKATVYIAKAKELATKLDFDKGIGFAILMEGKAKDNRSSFDSAIICYRQSIPYFDRANDIANKAAGYQGLGNAYWAKGLSDKALNNYMIALNLREQTSDSFAIACSEMGLGNVYSDLHKFKLSIKYDQLAMDIMQHLGEKKYVSWILNNIGAAYMENGDTAIATDYYMKSIVIKEELKDIYGLSTSYSNMGNIYLRQKEYQKALDYYNLSLKYRMQTNENNDREFSDSYNEIGSVYLEMKNYPEAEKQLKHSIELGEKIHSYEQLKNPYLSMSKLNSEQGDYKNAFEYYKKYHAAMDSLLNQESNKLVNEMSAKFESEKQEQQITAQQSEINNRKRSQNFLLILVALAVVLTFAMFRNYRIKQKANEQLEEKNELIAVQKHIVEEKNKDITDSIHYAKRIQQAILPSMEMQKKVLPQSFVLYKPKDIVSGDFFWMEQWGKETIVAAIDCTGHGVPGAFMSFVAYSLLNEAVIEHGITQPGIVLNEMRKSLNRMLRQKNDETALKDGMDIAVCSFDLENNTLQYAGAYNPLWLLRNGKLTEYKADKQPVGAFMDSEEIVPFTNNKISLQKGDVIYIFTDGYADQFGGNKGKKFKYKPLQELLLSICDQPMEEQHKILDQSIEEWKGNLEQVDDILVIGIRV
ncbi:MAG: protein serine/threonine phosphatase [Bacteroidetes bacterium]|nr:protein serine/threonine phosphatase [Bacteroidota bacterium]